MPLPIDFRFSQNNLQDFVDCPRRFQLRHVLRLAWPALQTEPVLEHERHIELGYRFHQMVQRHHAGVPLDALENQISDPDLLRWWRNYLRFAPPLIPPNPRIEYLLSAPFAGFRLLAKYDLVVLTPEGGARIIDWKTTRKRPQRAVLGARVQTRLYPLLLQKASAVLTGGSALQPGQIEMIYWFPEYPDQPEIFRPDADTLATDERYLTNLVHEIQALGDSTFPLTEDEKRCRFCNYRSLCARGVVAGAWDELDDADSLGNEPINLDFDQIAEIEF